MHQAIKVYCMDLILIQMNSKYILYHFAIFINFLDKVLTVMLQFFYDLSLVRTC